MTSKGADDEENCRDSGGGVANSEGENQSCTLCSETSGNGGGFRLYLAKDLRIGLLFAGLAVSCLLLFNSTNPLKFFPTSYYSSIGAGSPVPNSKDEFKYPSDPGFKTHWSHRSAFGVFTRSVRRREFTESRKLVRRNPDIPD
ncbi:hypothetical protein CRG98_016314 [Punica granatum]|uniref:Uncharacterized protein n=1 Tax=Punica granatum TaxID=22663 RepID=A0A2I0K596_PUNGR|nr:hypothetical protein CRG98_016314 [Punica granatum]